MNIYKAKVSILAVLAVLFGGCLTASAETVTEGFDNFKAGWNSGFTEWELTLPQGWNYSGQASNINVGDTYKTARPSIEVSVNNTDAYLITPTLEGTFSFYLRNYTKNYQASVTAYACTYENGEMTLGDELGSKTLSKTSSGVPSWEQVSFTASTETRVALLISRAYFDDFTYTPVGGSVNPDPDPDPDPQPDPVPVMEVSTTAVNFGMVTANATSNFTISNSGNGELTVAITSSNDEFTVSSSDITVAAGESEKVTITYLYNAEVFGEHTSTITLTPNKGDVATIAVSAYVKDPELWSEDFEAGVIPDGWTNDGWKVGTIDGIDNSTHMAQATVSYTATYLVTPRLEAKKDDVLTWDAYLRWDDEYLLVQYSDDEQATWTTIYNYRAEDEGHGNKYHLPMSFTAPADGHYYLRFKARFQNSVDNFIGFKLAPTEETHETWYVSYTFYYPADSDWESIVDTETMEVSYAGNKVSFNFPNPVNGNSWMSGTKDSNGNIIFNNGQYIGPYGGEKAYYCGTDGTSLTDMTFYVNESGDSYLCTNPILINSSATSMSYWYYFTNVVVSKNEITDGIQNITPNPSPKGDENHGIYDMQGRKIGNADTLSALKPGLYIINGRKVLVK